MQKTASRAWMGEVATWQVLVTGGTYNHKWVVTKVTSRIAKSQTMYVGVKNRPFLSCWFSSAELKEPPVKPFVKRWNSLNSDSSWVCVCAGLCLCFCLCMRARVRACVRRVCVLVCALVRSACWHNPQQEIRQKGNLASKNLAVLRSPATWKKNTKP